MKQQGLLAYGQLMTQHWSFDVFPVEFARELWNFRCSLRSGRLAQGKEKTMAQSRGKGILVAVFICLILNQTGALTQTRPRTITAATDLSSSLEAAAQIVGPSVVEIFTTSYIPGNGIVPSTADLITTQRASGSGIIIDSEGYIVTNAHVVRGAQRMRVEIPIPASGRSILATSSRTVSGRLIGIDIETDLAVIKVDEKNLPALEFGDSDELKAGQVVLAFGSPLGLHNSVSFGVVSSVARQLQPESPMIYVQTDASINPGSSGGPLVDLRGRLVGINTMIFSQAGGNEGLGFAAPSNIVRSVYEQIKKTGHVRRGDIGLRAQTVTPVLAAGLKLERDAGVVVADVLPGSSAERVGVRPGDIVLTLDGKSMENGRQLQVGLYRHLVGDVVTLEILRGGKTLSVPVAMTERQDPFGDLSASTDPREHLVPRLGILGLNLDQKLAAILPGLRVRSGVVVVSTVADAINASEGGFAAGDVIYAVNSRRILGLSDLHMILDELKAGDPVVLQLERQGVMMYLAFTVE
jgi:serine protease Do